MVAKSPAEHLSCHKMSDFFCRHRPTASLLRTLCLGLGFAQALAATESTWRSELYPADWSAAALESKRFYADKLIQDFSHAGYRSGDEPPPRVAGPIFDATAPAFGADPSGKTDSTAAIQAALDAAAANGRGVVLLPEGTYLVRPPEGRQEALLVSGSHTVLRGAGAGKTRILNTSWSMRGSAIVRFAGPKEAAFVGDVGRTVPLTRDLPGPTTRLPVEDVTPFAVGSWVVVRADMTDDWVREHKEPGWLGRGSVLGGFAYPRRIVTVDAARREIVVDVPTRYALWLRDKARIVLPAAQPLVECGIEDLALGNRQHPGSSWGETDWQKEGSGAYDSHDSWLLNFDRVRDAWVRRVDSFRPEENALEVHMLSNGIRLRDCRGVSVLECKMSHPQYGGGGGNGYMYRVHSSGENLLQRCLAEHSRHGFVFSHPASAGNVFHACIDRNTGKQAGSRGEEKTNGMSSDHHAWFSHSNLIDSCTADSSWFEACFRPWGSETKHNLTAAHSVYWHTTGLGSHGAVVRTEQSRYGYVIGTGGSRTKVARTTSGGSRCDPVDHVEGEGRADTLTPSSLYLDQLARRRAAPTLP